MSAELEAAGACLRAEPAGDDVLARLSAVVELVPRAIARDHREGALQAVGLVIDLERALPPESPARGSYRIALGRIGSPEAIGALKMAAGPGGRVLGRKPAGPRIAAINGLRAAGGPSAMAALRELAADRDPAVRESALRALEHPSGEG